MGNPGVEPGFSGAFVRGEMFFVVGYEELLDGGMATCDSCPARDESDEAPWKYVGCKEKETRCDEEEVEDCG